tara:strand:- start:45 stop:344 length:300 start_codon:yes stop_codon:yes gene_type:complete
MRTKKEVEGVIRSYTANIAAIRKLGGLGSEEHEGSYMVMIRILLWVIGGKGQFKVQDHYIDGQPHCLSFGKIDPEDRYSVVEKDIERLTEEIGGYNEEY